MEQYSKIFEEAIEVLDIWYDKQFLKAINSWGELYAKDSQAFTAFQPLNNFIKDRQKECVDNKYFEKDLNFLIQAYKEDDLERQSSYEAFSKLLFEISLNPQHWMHIDGLEKAYEYWKLESSSKTFMPYAGFMLGIVYAYLGKFKESLETLEKARDGMTNSKQQAAKIGPLITLVKTIVGDTLRPKKKSIYSEQDWLDAGFNKDDLQTWIYAEIEPKAAIVWKEKSFSAKDASRWHKAGFDIESALSWSKEFLPENAIQCKIAGFEDPKEASRWMKIFNFPSEAMRWKSVGFASKEAAVWIRQSVTDPVEAKKRKESMH